MVGGMPPKVPEERAELAMRMADLRDEIERLKGRMRRAVEAAVGVLVVFALAAVFLEGVARSLFLWIAWAALNLRFLAVYRSARVEVRSKESALDALLPGDG